MALMVSCAVCRDRSLCARGCRRRSSAFAFVPIPAMFWLRRRFLGGVLVVTGAYARGGSSVRKLDLIDAPNNLGLRPPKPRRRARHVARARCARGGRALEERAARQT